MRSSMTSQDIEGACRCQAGGANLGSIFNYPLLESVSPPLVACDCINQRGGVNHPPVEGTSLVTPFNYFIIKEAIIFCLQKLPSCCFLPSI